MQGVIGEIDRWNGVPSGGNPFEISRPLPNLIIEPRFFANQIDNVPSQYIVIGI